MLLLNIDRASPVPLYRQLCERVVALVEGGSLRPGDRLPSTRLLATSCGVHRSSVVRAFDELRALGYIDSRAGSYTTIRRRERPPATHQPEPAEDARQLLDWDDIARANPKSLAAHPAMHVSTTGPGRDTIDLDRLCADPSLAPDADLRRCIKRILVRTPGAVLDYADPGGWMPLRQALAKRMCNHGIAVSPDEIVITTGAQQALDLIMRYLLSPGDAVAVERPSYGLAHSLIRLHGVKSVEIRMLEDGMDLDALQRVMEGGTPPKLVFTMPNFQNPTGITTSQRHRERLLSLCEAHRVPLVEDGFEEEMKYFGQAVLPVKSMDSHGVVLYIGTFSKVVFPGLRVGWIAAPRQAVAHLANIVRASTISGNSLAQAVAAHYCSSSEFEIYLRRIHRVYRRRMQALLAGLEANMPVGVSWTRPSGGYTAWLSIGNCSVTEGELVKRLSLGGVLAGGGSRYFAAPPKSLHLRLSIACVAEAEISTACRRLGQVLSEVVG